MERVTDEYLVANIPDPIFSINLFPEEVNSGDPGLIELLIRNLDS